MTIDSTTLGLQADSVGKPTHVTFPLRVTEEAAASWIRTHSHRIGEPLLDRFVMLACLTTLVTPINVHVYY